MTTVNNILKLRSLDSDLTYKELKKECIIRGKPFPEIVRGDFPNLSNWLLIYHANPIDETLLEKYDNWVEDELNKLGSEYLIHPSLRLSYVGARSDDDTADKLVKSKTVKIAKVAKEKDSSGLYKGTKKSYTFELQQKGKTIQQTIIKVLRKFPDAKEKSIKIWFNRARKG